MELNFWQAFTFARHGRPAPCAESSQPAGRGIKLGYLPLGDRKRITPESDKGGSRGSRMLATALAVAP
jgi:hypothetical protein